VLLPAEAAQVELDAVDALQEPDGVVDALPRGHRADRVDERRGDPARHAG
jgi:hypothetical protein